MAVPMVASALSTIIATVPLFAAQTLILFRFASIIFVTMLVGMAYVFLFLTPMLAMFGPGPTKKMAISEDTPIRTIIIEFLWKSKAVRFIGVTLIGLVILVRHVSSFPVVRILLCLVVKLLLRFVSFQVHYFTSQLFCGSLHS